jgi:tRNA modification GTPase
LEPLFDCKNFKELKDTQKFLSSQVLWVSAFDKMVRRDVLNALLSQLQRDERENQVLLVQARHFENLSQAFQLVGQSLEHLRKNTSPEYLSLDLKQSLICLQEVLGKRFDDQIMDRVFKEFCIGK